VALPGENIVGLVVTGKSPPSPFFQRATFHGILASACCEAMTSATVTFDEIERVANRARAYALLAQTSKQVWVATILLWEVSRKVRGFVKFLTPERIEAVPAHRVKEMTANLQELHRLLVASSCSQGASGLTTSPVFGSMIKSLQESTEDLGDIIEDLVLADDPEYQGLVASCAASLGLAPTSESSARLQR
jgi:hypothetical protein